MNGWAKHPLRVGIRLGWLAGEVFLAAVAYGTRCLWCAPGTLQTARAIWLQRCSRRALRIFGVQTSVAGIVPARGLLVCNHLSYLDVLVLAALAPSVFVAKAEVRSWPVFGWFARLAGTIFVDRRRRLRAGESSVEIAAALNQGALVVLFPEGTSSGGGTILPFKSALLEPAARPGHALTVGLVAYDLTDGDVSEEVCYWKEMCFVPHLINLLSKHSIRAAVGFRGMPQRSGTRKEAARQLHSEALRLKETALV